MQQAAASDCGRRCGAAARRLLQIPAFDERHDVLLGDASAEAGAGDLREIDIVFAGDFAD